MAASRELCRALGAEHVRHRREASPAVVLRRLLLSLDYVLERPAPWLATEAEKVAALTAAGAPERALPRRVYWGRRDSRRRYFAHKLPLALGAERATFVFVQAEDVVPSGVRTWGETHAALRAAGRAVEVVVVGRDPERLAAAQPVLDALTRAPAPPDARPNGPARRPAAPRWSSRRPRGGGAGRSGRPGDLRRHQRRPGAHARQGGSQDRGRGGASDHERPAASGPTRALQCLLLCRATPCGSSGRWLSSAGSLTTRAARADPPLCAASSPAHACHSGTSSERRYEAGHRSAALSSTAPRVRPGPFPIMRGDDRPADQPGEHSTPRGRGASVVCPERLSLAALSTRRLMLPYRNPSASPQSGQQPVVQVRPEWIDTADPVPYTGRNGDGDDPRRRVATIDVGSDGGPGTGRRAADSLSLRSFLRLAPPASPPVHSTISRTRRLLSPLRLRLPGHDGCVS